MTTTARREREFPQRRVTWQARRTRSGFTIVFRLRASRLIEMTFLVNVPEKLSDGQTGTAVLRFFIDRRDSQDAPQEAAGA